MGLAPRFADPSVSASERTETNDAVSQSQQGNGGGTNGNHTDQEDGQDLEGRPQEEAIAE